MRHNLTPWFPMCTYGKMVVHLYANVMPQRLSFKEFPLTWKIWSDVQMTEHDICWNTITVGAVVSTLSYYLLPSLIAKEYIYPIPPFALPSILKIKKKTKVHHTLTYHSVQTIHTDLIRDRYRQYISTLPCIMCLYAQYSLVHIVPTVGRYISMDRKNESWKK